MVTATNHLPLCILTEKDKTETLEDLQNGDDHLQPLVLRV